MNIDNIIKKWKNFCELGCYRFVVERTEDVSSDKVVLQYEGFDGCIRIHKFIDGSAEHSVNIYEGRQRDIENFFRFYSKYINTGEE